MDLYFEWAVRITFRLRFQKFRNRFIASNCMKVASEQHLCCIVVSNILLILEHPPLGCRAFSCSLSSKSILSAWDPTLGELSLYCHLSLVYCWLPLTPCVVIVYRPPRPCCFSPFLNFCVWSTINFQCCIEGLLFPWRFIVVLYVFVVSNWIQS